MKKANGVYLGVYLSPKLRKLIASAAKKRGVKDSQLAREAMANYLDAPELAAMAPPGRRWPKKS